MNLLRLTLKFLLQKPLLTLVSVLLIMIPVSIITFIIIFDIQAKDYLYRNSGTIDLVLGAKGDPAQLINSSIFNFGPFAGSISLSDTRQIVRNRVVKLAIPLHSVDNYRGFRITGTNMNYTELNKASLMQGAWWQSEMDAVAGYEVAKKLKLHPGDTFFSCHGLEPGGISHGDKAFRVVGIMKKSNLSLDNVILCSIQSVWLLHRNDLVTGETSNSGAVSKGPDDYFPFDFPEGEGKDLSAVLIQLRSPVSASSFIPSDLTGSNFQVLSPLIEISKMYRSVQFTLGALGWLGFSLSGIALLFLFVQLYYFVDEKSDDIFLIRKLGATRKMASLIVILQGLIIADTAAFSGIVLSHIALGTAGTFPEGKFLYGQSGTGFYWTELIIYLLVLFACTLISIIPGLKAGSIIIPDSRRADIS
jgi:putative ABC transport system permease protein